MVEIPVINLGMEIRRVMAEKHISPSALASKLNMGPSSVSRLLSKDNMDVKQLMEVSRAVDFNFFSLYTGAVNAVQQSNELQQRVAALEEEVKKKDGRIADLEEKVSWAKTVLEVLKKK